MSMINTSHPPCCLSGQSRGARTGSTALAGVETARLQRLAGGNNALDAMPNWNEECRDLVSMWGVCPVLQGMASGVETTSDQGRDILTFSSGPKPRARAAFDRCET